MQALFDIAIVKRHTSQKIELSIKESSISGESDIKFENNSWSRNTLSKNLEVFGTEFIHKNLFTGLTILPHFGRTSGKLV